MTTFPTKLRLKLKILVPPEAATLVRKGSHTGQAIRNDGFFFVCQ